MARTFALSLLGLTLTAQTPRQDAYKIGNGVSAPRVIRKVEPNYTNEARHAFSQGTVLLQVVIGTDGKAHEYQVLHSLGLGLDENAIAAVEAWEFKPGEKAGAPVNVIATIEVNYVLMGGKHAVDWHLGPVEFRTPNGALRPTIERSLAPRHSRSARKATATVALDVDEQGKPIHLKIEETSDDEWGAEVMSALLGWRFNPGTKDGTPVAVPCTMEFVRGK